LLTATTRRMFSNRPPVSLSNKSAAEEDEAERSAKLLKGILAKIRLTGPMTLAQYMQEALTNPKGGYYSRKEHVLGQSGDFVTSPELSQMFGECLAVWLVYEWRKMGAPKPLQVVELGPGRGTLADDVMRTMKALSPKDLEDTSLHLVEVSPRMRQLQVPQLCGYGADLKSEKLRTKHGVNVRWYADLASVPRGFSLFVAHEFLDALPVHQFVKGAAGCWHEVLVDVDPVDSERLRWVRSRERTPNAIHIAQEETREVVEVCPKAGLVVRELCDRVAKEGGAALLGDYGHGGDGGDTFRAFRGHRAHDPLVQPGRADLTADVDFAYLRRQCTSDVMAYGPVEQAAFLTSLGLEIRKERLIEHCKDREEMKKGIEEAYRVLTAEDEMGRRFKFMSIFPATMNPIHDVTPPVGFPTTKG